MALVRRAKLQWLDADQSKLDRFPGPYWSHGEMMIMANDKMMMQISVKDGFIAALDQSGGSTPGALRL